MIKIKIYAKSVIITLFIVAVSLGTANGDPENNIASKLIKDESMPACTPITLKQTNKLWSQIGLDKKFLDIHGYVENRNYFHYDRNNNKDYFFYELRDNFRLSKEIRFSDNVSGMASVDGRFYDFINRRGDKGMVRRVEPWEMYLDCNSDVLDIRIGQQLIRWGKSDEVNPTDVFTPEDLSEFINEVERAKRKLPVIALKSDYYYKDYALEAIWLPFFRRTRLDGAGGDWEAYLPRYYRGLGLPFDSDKGPGQRISKSSYALKLKKEGEHYDISVSYSYHYAEIPALELRDFTILPFLPPGKAVHPVYPRQHTIGSDFETTFGKIGIRGEGAITTNTPFVSTDITRSNPVIYRPALNYVIGMDYTYPENLYINLQYSVQYIFDYPNQLATQQWEDSIIWRVTKTFRNETIILRTTNRYYLSTTDMSTEGEAEFKITDDFHITFGIFLFDGPFDGIFGQFKKNDQLFIRTKYYF